MKNAEIRNETKKCPPIRDYDFPNAVRAQRKITEK
jgi:hypothetical protein